MGFFFSTESVWKILCENARPRKNIAKYNLPPDGMYVCGGRNRADLRQNLVNFIGQLQSFLTTGAM